MNSSRELLARYLDDRESLNDADWEQLLLLLREQPQLAVELRAQLMLDDLLSQKLALDRVDFSLQMSQRVNDYEHKIEETFDHVAELRAMAEEELKQPRPAETAAWKTWSLSLAAALSLLLFVGGVAWWVNPLEAPVLAVVEEASGEVAHTHGSQVASAKIGDELRYGEKLQTGADGTVVWRYQDNTRIRLEANAAAELKYHPRHQGKRIELTQGSLWAQISPQIKGKEMTFQTPHAEAVVVGTEFRLAIREHDTELEVTEGVVEFQRNGDANVVRVVANELSLANAERIELKTVAWPSQRDDLAFLFTNASDLTVARNPQTNAMRETPLEERGLVDYLHGRALLLQGGSFTSQDAGDDLRALFHDRQDLTVELILTTAEEQPEAGLVIGYRSHGDKSNWSLSQTKEAWLARLLTEQTAGRSAELKFSTKADPFVHVAWTYRPGEWKGYINGELAGKRDDIHGNFRPWENGLFTVGADADQKSAWPGTIFGIAVYRRVLEGDELRRNARNGRVIYGPLAGWEHM
jgi:ferric-dicitrate binding protein FerR (iron transport regulator)